MADPAVYCCLCSVCSVVCDLTEVLTTGLGFELTSGEAANAVELLPAAPPSRH